MNPIYIILDINNTTPNYVPPFNPTVGDSNLTELNFVLVNNGQPFDLTGLTAKISLGKADGTSTFANATITNITGGAISYILQTSDISFAGQVNAEIILYNSSGGRLTSVPFDFQVKQGVLSESSVVSNNNFSALTEALSQVTGIANKADKSYVDSNLVTVNTEIATKKTYAISADRYLCYANVLTQRNPLYIIGDSITEGTATLDFTRDNYASIIRMGMQKHYNNRNYGFCNFNTHLQGTGIKLYHTWVATGFNAHTECFEPNYFGGIRLTSTAINDNIAITFTGKDAILVYAGNVTYGAVLQVKLDGVVVGTIDTKVHGANLNADFSTAIVASSWGTHIITLTNSDGKTAEICGMIYLEDSTQITPVVYNVGRSSITTDEIPDSMLDLYSSTGMVILALGVNDQLLSTDIPTFQAKIKRICDNIVANKGSLIICDMMFSLAVNDPYEVALRAVVSQYNDFPFLDFAKLWFDDPAVNKFANFLAPDGVHPTVAGHEFIGNLILKTMGLPYTKAQLLNDTSQFINVTGFSNGWYNTISPVCNPTGFMKKSNGEVLLQGNVKGGTITYGTSIFTLPSGYRPINEIHRPIANNGVYGELYIKSDGTVNVYSLGNNAMVSLEGISFFAQ